MNSQTNLVQDHIAGQDTGNLIPLRSDDTVQACMGRTFNYILANAGRREPFAKR